MPLTLDEIKQKHDKAFNSGQITRERGADDLVFYWITQWDDNSLAETQLGYRGEFDILRKAGRGIMSDLASNPVQVDFEPIDEDRDDSADLLDGLYRSDDNRNSSIESYGNASQEAIVCGIGAWELYTEYASSRGGNLNQVIKRRPIWEANNTCYFDPNAKMLDKSDGNYASILFAYSEDGYKELTKELTGEELEKINWENFKSPEISYVFPWVGGEGRKIYVATFYHREKVKDKILTMTNPMGQSVQLLESALSDVMDDMLDTGFSIENEKEIERWEVRKYIASGKEILNGDYDEETDERMGEVIAGENIPVVPTYGEHAYVEGEEHYEGVTRLAKDPQRLRNFCMSYLSDILSRSPREKPIFFQEQIAGHENMYEQTGSENNFPYVLMNRKAEGQDLPPGPVGVLPAPNIPPALGPLIDLTRQAVEDVANPGTPQDISDPAISGKAVLALQARLDMQSMIYQENLKHAKRRDGEIYASMAAEIYDVPRNAKITMPDGTRKDAQIMETVIDAETGDIVTLNDISNVEFEVYSKIGASYSSQKEQTLDRIEKLLQGINPADPKYNLLLLQYLSLMDGTDFDSVRDYVKEEQLMLGFRKPETPEEEKVVADRAERGQEPGADMVLAMAEQLKGQAANKEADLKQVDVRLKAENERMKREIEVFRAQTDRIDTQVDAQESGANIDMKRVDTFGKQLDNQGKIIELRKPGNMSNDELYQQIAG